VRSRRGRAIERGRARVVRVLHRAHCDLSWARVHLEDEPVYRPACASIRRRSSGFQAKPKHRGGRNTGVGFHAAAGARSRLVRNDRTCGGRPATAWPHARRSSPASGAPAGADNGGRPVHHAPEHGRRRAGSEPDGNCPARLATSSRSGARARSRSARDVTECEHPADAPVGARSAHATSGTSALIGFFRPRTKIVCSSHGALSRQPGASRIGEARRHDAVEPVHD
jgi:hypothetical protein